MGLRGANNSLVFWVVFLGIHLNTKEKKIRVLTIQPEIIAKLILKTLFHVTEMKISKKIIPKTFFHVIL